MSYDLNISVDMGGKSPIYLLSKNYTSNVRPILMDIFDPEDDNTGLWVLNGATGKRASQLIHVALIRLRSYPSKYAALAPKNKWGDPESLYAWLKEIKETCDNAPNAIIEVSC